MTTIDDQAALLEQTQTDTRASTAPEQRGEFRYGDRASAGSQYRAADRQRQLRAGAESDMGRDHLLDVDVQVRTHTVMGDDLLGVNTRAQRAGSSHGQLHIRCRIDNSREIVERKPDAAEAPTTACTRIEEAQVQACRRFNARAAECCRHRKDMRKTEYPDYRARCESSDRGARVIKS